MILEACVEGVDQAIRAEALGATRIELCANLDADGLTPDNATIKKAKEELTIPIRVIIRPRAGDFVYSVDEINTMKTSIDFCKEVGVEGVVFGMTTNNRSLDIGKINMLANYAKPLKVCIHKAIDATDDPVKELERLIKLGNIDSVLTSGKEPTAKEGKACLKKMLALAGDQIEVIACGKVIVENLGAVHAAIRAKAYHGKKIVGEL